MLWAIAYKRTSVNGIIEVNFLNCMFGNHIIPVCTYENREVAELAARDHDLRQGTLWKRYVAVPLPSVLQ